MITLSSSVQASPDMLTADVEGETVMMDAESGYYYNLDPIGSRIWHALAEPTRVDALCDRLAEDFDAPIEVIRKDVLALLESLVERKLLLVEGD
ncbi:PqqD family protein [Rhizorhabdus phycosphaerae]|uniref:PqqD family protein n=1 Tax=Rhizorhabdus phycosphaerae TaxID=2711156 RepID=UPI0013E9FD81|nr:PqqD family protein [Rhizorhabdus phycosphaerae]